MTAYDYLIVGAGLFGATCARELAEAGKRVLVLERADHVGGMVYDELQDGIRVSRHGGHIFHTNDRALWAYVNRFAEWQQYSHHVKAMAGGEVYSLPINLGTLQQVYGARNRAEAELALARVQQPQPAAGCENVASWCLANIGPQLYGLFVEGYTRKQWGADPAALPASLIRRLPVRLDWNDHYFSDAYQGLPVGGYTALVENMLAHANIELGLGDDFLEQAEAWQALAGRTIYTGPLDALLNYEFGPLPYRSLRWEWERLEVPDYQGCAAMNYCDGDVPYTRVVEWKHWWTTPALAHTVICREYPAAEGPPYYPLSDDASRGLHARYAARAAERYPQLVPAGRLGSYKYLDMHQAVAGALQLVKKELA